MTIDVTTLFERGGEILRRKHQDEEKTKVGTLRAGNTGLYDKETNTVAGSCARKTLLRHMGLEVEEDEEETGSDRTLMFEAGVKNEDSWYERLKESWHGVILRESEVPVVWQVDGTPVTGRPDIVLAYENARLPGDAGNPQGEQINPTLTYVHGIELKLISSLWTARDVLSNSPKAIHMMQAGHYMGKLGVPFSLCYTNRADMAVLGFAMKHFPKMNQEGSQYCEYNEKGEIKKVRPFMKEFVLEWGTDGFLHYTDKDTGRRTKSIVSIERIEAYYKYVLSLKQENKIGVKPSNLYPNGQKMNFDLCDYCPVKPVCDKYDSKNSQLKPNLDTWLGDVKELIAKK